LPSRQPLIEHARLIQPKAKLHVFAPDQAFIKSTEFLKYPSSHAKERNRIDKLRLATLGQPKMRIANPEWMGQSLNDAPSRQCLRSRQRFPNSSHIVDFVLSQSIHAAGDVMAVISSMGVHPHHNGATGVFNPEVQGSGSHTFGVVQHRKERMVTGKAVKNFTRAIIAQAVNHEYFQAIFGKIICEHGFEAASDERPLISAGNDNRDDRVCVKKRTRDPWRFSL